MQSKFRWRTSAHNVALRVRLINWGLRDYGNPAQIGLERTPEEYVASLVAVFREVWRVLKDDGTLWLNLGDSYAGSGRGRNPPESKWSGFMGNAERERSAMPHLQSKQIEAGAIGRNWVAPPPGLKCKDLVGIPWMVAKALQAPYYTGQIKDERDRIWLAAMLDAEGCMFIHKRKAGQHNGQGYFRQNDSYSPGVEIANTSLAVVERIMALVGKGSICTQGPDETSGRRKQTIYRWNLRTNECRDFVRELYPHLIAKQQQARILIGCLSSGERADAAHAALMALHRTGLSDVDFAAPESMFQPGYYLRSDIVWSKSNPMPESVRDRPTKSHEYIFLLSKAERYYFDADAVRESYARPYEDGPGFGGFANRANTKARQLSDAMPELNRTGYGPNAKVGDGRNIRSVWNIATQPYSGAHFATFPEDIPKRCILAGSKPGDVILDPFYGSGTTLKVATDLGREAVGLDISRDYHRLAKKRTITTIGLAL
mgnify:CR=1 FL=1